ncbi:hypothetical protein AV530_017021 [Patagioenas fasciata monilis]|uniref:Uncharacterized protein n=1 Tax=Patagioenas fasciata monilis TaxID=372326 RepID=A0A1V4J5R2_PATFA|nr:hypothetical protein AV530_017021 [Patagioenas fasciata monilis]
MENRLSAATQNTTGSHLDIGNCKSDKTQQVTSLKSDNLSTRDIHVNKPSAYPVYKLLHGNTSSGLSQSTRSMRGCSKEWWQESVPGAPKILSDC